jgi:hypothetical protein
LAKAPAGLEVAVMIRVIDGILDVQGTRLGGEPRKAARTSCSMLILSLNP